MAKWKAKPASNSARRKRPTLESLEDRNLLAAMPMAVAQVVEPPSVPAIEAIPRTGDDVIDGRDYVIWRKTLGAGASPVAGIGGGDLNDWQSNYGAGGNAAAIGGGVDILIANTGGDRVVDLALECFTSEPKDAAAATSSDARGRLLVGTDQGIFRRGSASAASAPTGKLYVGTEVGVFSTAAANNRGKLVVGVDSVDRRNGRDLLLGGAGDDILVGGQTTHDARGGDPTTSSDDVIVDGPIITAENPVSAGQTVRLRFAAANNAGK